jgi:hypothetical protein
MAHQMMACHAFHRMAAAATEQGCSHSFGSRIVGSAILHALILPPLLLSTHPGQPVVIIPLDIVVLADLTTGPQQPDTAIVPLQEAGASTPTRLG